MKTRDLDRVLDRLGAGGEKNRLLWCGAGCRGVQLLGKLNVALVRGHLKTGVREALELAAKRGLHFRMQVAGVEHRDAACKVDEAAALDIPQFGVRRALRVDHEGVRYATRDGVLAALLQIGIGAHGKRNLQVAGCMLENDCTEKSDEAF